MKSVSQNHLDLLFAAHGNPREIMQALTAVEAGQYIPLENLLDSVRSLSTDISKHNPNAYVFASGSVNTPFDKYPNNPLPDVDYQKYTKLLAENGEKIATIGNTQASSFLEKNQVFSSRLSETIKGEDIRNAAGKPLKSNDILQGYAGDNGNRVSGLWDDISRGYAEHAQGHIITVTPNASAERIFVQTELPALLDNPKIDTMNGLPKQVFVDEFDRLKSAGMASEQAYRQLSDTLVKSSSISFMDKFAASKFKADLGTNMRNDFTASTREDIVSLVDEAKPQHIGLSPIIDASEDTLPKAGILRETFESVAPFAKKLGYAAVGAIPIVGYLGNSAEASELKGELQTAINHGDISSESVLAYGVIMEGHKIQGGLDPTIFGEVGIQAAYHDWADRYNVSDEWREKLEPSSIGKMMIEGSIYIGENGHKLPSAVVDVGSLAAEQTIAGAGYVVDAADSAYDYMSGNTADMQDIYDGLPVLESAANDDIYDPSNIDVDPIHSYPMAHDLAQIKTEIVNTQDMIGEINQGTKEPFNHMDNAESTDFLQGRIDRLNDRFESNYEQARSDGTLDEVTSYVEQHGEFNDVQSTPSLAVQDTEPAANQSWDAPKALAM